MSSSLEQRLDRLDVFFIMSGVCQNGPFVFQRIRDHDEFSDGSELAPEQCPILLKRKVKWKAVCVVPRKCISRSSMRESSLSALSATFAKSEQWDAPVKICRV